MKGRTLQNRFSPRGLLILGFTLAVPAVFLFLPPLPQWASYHAFADRRSFLGIPNFLDLISNIPFLLVGIMGLGVRLRPRFAFRDSAEEWPYLIFFLGVVLTALGSAYYHLAPDNSRLVWDRLPMALAFMAFFAAVITERISIKAGLYLLLPLIILGAASVLYWHYSELRGAGDLRPYALVQLYPLLAIPLILLLYPPKYTHSGYLWWALIFYVLAKGFELLDAEIFSLGHIVSGHTLKHLAAALAAYWLVRMLQKRRPQPAPLGH